MKNLLKSLLVLATTLMVVGVGAVAAPVSAAGIATQKKCTNDDSISWRVCVTMHYSVYQKQGYGPSYAVHKYTYKYTKLEASQLTKVIDAWALVSVNGPCQLDCGGTNYVQNEKRPTIGPAGVPVDGTVYTYTPPWAGKYILVADNWWQGSNARAKVKRYETTWSFKSETVVHGSVSGW